MNNDVDAAQVFAHGISNFRAALRVVSSFFRTLILAERQLDRAQAVVLLI